MYYKILYTNAEWVFILAKRDWKLNSRKIELEGRALE